MSEAVAINSYIQIVLPIKGRAIEWKTNLFQTVHLSQIGYLHFPSAKLKQLEVKCTI